jgi:hypothetical protein
VIPRGNCSGALRLTFLGTWLSNRLSVWPSRDGRACVERAADPLHCTGIYAKPFGYLANALCAPWLVQSLTDSLLHLGRDGRAAEALALALGPLPAQRGLVPE